MNKIWKYIVLVFLSLSSSFFIVKVEEVKAEDEVDRVFKCFYKPVAISFDTKEGEKFVRITASQIKKGNWQVYQYTKSGVKFSYKFYNPDNEKLYK